MSDLSALQLELETKRSLRAAADARFRALSGEEPEAAEDPMALQDIEQDAARLRDEISALDVEIAELEQKITSLGGSVR
jgi:predicted  nucleic acid-binding Zn-ribbon protein